MSISDLIAGMRSTLRDLSEALPQSDGEKRDALNRALREKYPKAYYCYVVDTYSDTGVCIFQVDSSLWGMSLYRVDYVVNGDGTVAITSEPVMVVSRTVYEPVDGDDSDVDYDESKVTERDIPEEERKKIPARDFAGKDRSFPIARPEDVAAAAASIGRAGSDNYPTETLKKRIISIAKRKGSAYVKKLPKKWRDEMAESYGLVSSVEASTSALAERTLLEFAESAVPCDFKESAIRKDGTIDIKLIAPGWGSSGYYPSEVLERDGPNIFKTGTHMYWNHATESEDKERPEGDLSKLVGVTVRDAYYSKTHKDGEGLYATAKVFSDYNAMVNERAAHIGLSIRGTGYSQEGTAGGRDGTIILELTRGKSVDYVTRAGAGGKILEVAESVAVSARSDEGNEMVTQEQFDAMQEQLKKLQEAQNSWTTDRQSMQAEIDRGREYRLINESSQLVTSIVAGNKELHAITKARIVATFRESVPPTTEDGKLDADTLRTRIEEAIKAEMEYATNLATSFSESRGNGRIVGMGSASEAQVQQQTTEQVEAETLEAFRDLGLSESAAAVALKGR